MAKTEHKRPLGRRHRAPPLTSERIVGIVALINGWKGRLTWEALCEAYARESGAKYTRQALYNYVEIKAAYKAYCVKPTPSHEIKKLSKTQQKIRDLERKVEELEAVRDALLEKFTRWAVNASTRNLDEAFLDQPLRRISRSENR
jgi:hypothetical protein